MLCVINSELSASYLVFFPTSLQIMLFYVKQQQFFTMSYRELKRLDSTSRSPIYALLGKSIDGVLTIRAFEAELKLTGRMVDMLDVRTEICDHVLLITMIPSHHVALLYLPPSLSSTTTRLRSSKQHTT